ncbi:hypothetical protein J437_LFUL003644 [Ladona fulva]|uniref:Uncharacterized protein n=1 Tax=Ladona fulva TaxID=123851 RepID=A0A8K0K457_LADFU|nr:hypothetical protein J437_LFUL003644 [Ladona fulva]
MAEARTKYRLNNPEKVSRAVKKYQALNPLIVKKATKKYQEANPEIVRKAITEYKEANPEIVRKAITKVEEERLAWHKFNQSKLLRVASRQELDETIVAEGGPKIVSKTWLPHAYIALKVQEEPKTSADIDSFIRATIPSEDEADGRLRKLVLQHMLHGPCGDDKPNAPCMDSKRKTCSKGFPKPTCEVTYIDDRGYVHYKQKQNDVLIVKNDISSNIWNFIPPLPLKFLTDNSLVTEQSQIHEFR